MGKGSKREFDSDGDGYSSAEDVSAAKRMSIPRTPEAAPVSLVPPVSPIQILANVTYCRCVFQLFTFDRRRIADTGATLGKTPEKNNRIKLRTHEGTNHPKVKIISAPSQTYVGESFPEDYAALGATWEVKVALLVVNSYALYSRQGSDNDSLKPFGIERGHLSYARDQVVLILSLYENLRRDDSDKLSPNFEVEMAEYFGDIYKIKEYYDEMALVVDYSLVTKDEIRKLQTRYNETLIASDKTRGFVNARSARSGRAEANSLSLSEAASSGFKKVHFVPRSLVGKLSTEQSTSVLAVTGGARKDTGVKSRARAVASSIATGGLYHGLLSSPIAASATRSVGGSGLYDDLPSKDTVSKIMQEPKELPGLYDDLPPPVGSSKVFVSADDLEPSVSLGKSIKPKNY